MSTAEQQSSNSKANTSQHAKNRNARLMAVQGLYEVLHNKNPIKQCIHDYLSQKYDAEIDGQELVSPNGKLLRDILEGVDSRFKELQEIVLSSLEENVKEPEFLLKSILLCACFELIAHHDIDAPIIINDYLDITHGFYEKGQVKLVNGVLDKIAHLVRA